MMRESGDRPDTHRGLSSTSKGRSMSTHPCKSLLVTWRASILLAVTLAASAAVRGAIRGAITDPLGAPVPGAAVTLLQNGKNIEEAHTGRNGTFVFAEPAAGAYQIRASAAGFTGTTSAVFYVRAGRPARVNLRLKIGVLKQQVVVSATGSPVPESQVGASVDVLTRQELEALSKLDVLDALRLVPGVQVVQESQRGSVASVFIRGGNGGNDNFNKILLDGIPVNDIGGGFDFSNLATSGVDELEVFRGPDSILYGSDALAGVISITTRRGSTPTPQFTYSADGGNFETYRQEASVGGTFHQFDYYSDFMRFDTQNSLPNNSFHNATYTGNFGWKPIQNASVRFTVHHDATGLGSSNALALYAIPDDSFQRQQDTDLGLTAEDQTTSRWHNLLRLTSAHIHYHFDTPGPAGIPFSAPSLGTNYLGEPVTICGGNGYCASGQAILDYGGVYPMIFDSVTAVRSIDGQTDYAFRRNVEATAGFEYLNESGSSQSSGFLRSGATRNNYDGFLEARGNLRDRLFATAGLGIESNAVFGFANSPRASLAYYARRPAAAASWGHTKLNFNFGTGIKEPSLADQESSLFDVLSQVSGGAGLIARYRISPVGAERSTSLDAGIEQGFWGERLRLGATYFHERFYDLVDFVPQSALPGLGVPPPVAAQAPFGAYINSDSFRSQGAEVDFAASLRPGLAVRAAYTYLDAVVTQSFSSSALFPAFNPAFPNIPIGADAPLVGARPFRRPSNSGSVFLTYSRRRFGVSVDGYLAGRSDDSTYLSDAFFGDTMLLPNHNLLAAYQLVGFSGWYNVRRHITLYTSASNILGEHYQAAFGFPALPFTFRAGVRFTVGGGR